MNTIDVLVVVDVEGALADNNLHNNIYLIDTNKYMGSYREGDPELVTACKDRESINWRIQPVSPNNEAEIVGFTGQMINSRICVPVKEGSDDDVFWHGTVETQGAKGQYQYSIQVKMHNRTMEFDPFINVK